MASQLQTIVDELGNRLQRSVAIDDLRLRLQAYSPHFGPVDDTRLESILHRDAPDSSKSWVLSQGIAQAPGPVRLSANEALGLLPRVCAPIRCQKLLLGYLWLIDADESLSESELDVIADSADAAGVVMYREQLLHELEEGRERELLRDLLAEEPRVRKHAASALVDAEMFLPGLAVAALVVHVRPATDQTIDDTVQVRIGTALGHARRRFPGRQALHLARLDHGVLIAAAKNVGRRVTLTEIGAEVHSELVKQLGDEWQVVVGIGSSQPRLAEAVVSYKQAVQAARVAEIVPSFDAVVPWSQLGIYSILSRLPAEELTSEALHPGLLQLLNTDGADSLLETLECYLDRAGDAKATAAELLIHRSSLYYRLSKIEEIAGVNLSEGGDRLSLHLGLKLARLAGIRR